MTDFAPVAVEANAASLYWPHAFAQNTKADLIMKRLIAWKTVVDTVQTQLKEITNAEQIYASAYKRMALAFQEGFTDMGGQVGDTLDGIVEFSEKQGLFHSHLGDFLEQTFSKRLLDLRLEMDAKLRTIRTAVEQQQQQLAQQREEALQLIEQHTRACKSAENGDVSQADPWLTEFKLQESLSGLHNTETDFNKRLMNLHMQLFRTDDELSTIFKKTWLGFTEEKMRQLTLCVESTQNLQNSALLIEAEQELQAFTKRTKLDELVFEEESNARNLSYPYRESAWAHPVQMGMMSRREQSIKINRKWKDVYVVLTECSHLHCFNAKDRIPPPLPGSSSVNQFASSGTAPQASSPQQQQQQQQPPQQPQQQPQQQQLSLHVDVFTQETTPPPVQPSEKSVAGQKFLTSTEFTAKMVNEIESLTPSWSMFLRGSILIIGKFDPSEKLVFEIVVPPAKKIFSREVRHALRAISEDSLRSWTSAIRTKAKQVTSDTDPAYATYSQPISPSSSSSSLSSSSSSSTTTTSTAGSPSALISDTAKNAIRRAVLPIKMRPTSRVIYSETAYAAEVALAKEASYVKDTFAKEVQLIDIDSDTSSPPPPPPIPSSPPEPAKAPPPIPTRRPTLTLAAALADLTGKKGDSRGFLSKPEKPTSSSPSRTPSPPPDPQESQSTSAKRVPPRPTRRPPIAKERSEDNLAEPSLCLIPPARSTLLEALLIANYDDVLAPDPADLAASDPFFVAAELEATAKDRAGDDGDEDTRLPPRPRAHSSMNNIKIDTSNNNNNNNDNNNHSHNNNRSKDEDDLYMFSEDRSTAL